MIGSSRQYAIGMAHFQLGGGWRSLLIVLGIYLTLFTGGIGLFYYESYLDVQRGGPGFGGLRGGGQAVLVVLMGLQALALLLMGGGRVAGAIRTDLSSNMIESHRLMPVSSGNAVLGYLLGPTAPVIAFAILNMLLSMAFGASMGSDFGRMVINQVVLFAFALFFWSLVAMGTFAYRNIFALMIAGVFLGTCGRLIQVAYLGVPALGVLLTPFVGETVFNLAGTAPRMDSAYAFGIAGQAVFFLIFFTGTCRLFRGTYPSALSSGLGLLVMAVWGGLSAAGIHFALDSAARFGLFGRMGDSLSASGQITGAVCSCLVISVAAHWPMVREGRRRLQNWPVRAVFLLAAGVLSCLPLLGARAAPMMNANLPLLTFVSCMAQVIVIYSMMWVMRNATFLIALIATAGAMAALWFAPLVLEVIRISFFAPDAGAGQGMSALASLSPPALLAQIWSEDNPVYLAGLIWQWIVAALALAMMALAAGRARKRLRMAHARAWNTGPSGAPSPDNSLRAPEPQSASPSSEPGPEQA